MGDCRVCLRTNTQNRNGFLNVARNVCPTLTVIAAFSGPAQRQNRVRETPGRHPEQRVRVHRRAASRTGTRQDVRVQPWQTTRRQALWDITLKIHIKT